MGKERIELRHGYLKSTGSPVGYVSWVSSEGKVLLAANIVGGAIKVFDVGDEAPLRGSVRRSLILMTVAFYWWEQAARGD